MNWASVEPSLIILSFEQPRMADSSGQELSIQVTSMSPGPRPMSGAESIFVKYGTFSVLGSDKHQEQKDA